MPTITKETITAYAHCRDAWCAGGDQEELQGVRTTNEYSYKDLGGDMPGIERSTQTVQFADEAAQAPCPFCGTLREITDQKRPKLHAHSGYAQDGLLKIKHMG